MQDGSDAAAAGVGLVLALVYIVVVLAFLALHIYVLVDLLKHSDAAWQAAGQNKVLWIVLWLLCCGTLYDIVYWFFIRPKLTASASGGYG
jgi:hypothetical protein